MSVTNIEGDLVVEPGFEAIGDGGGGSVAVTVFEIVLLVDFLMLGAEWRASLGVLGNESVDVGHVN